MDAYVEDLPNVVDRRHPPSDHPHRRDPLGGASVDHLGAIAERHSLELTVVPTADPVWRFMTLDTDGKIRMDCSSPNAMASPTANRDRSRSPPATTPTPTGTASSP